MIILDYVKKEMKNPTISLNDIKQSIIKKYICNEINGPYIQSLMKSNKDLQHVEERDEQMSKYIHRLLYDSNNHRYFFAIGAGIL
jgi:hypothetical protein